MTFLTPLALFGLAAAAIPLLLHIFNLRKLKTVDFSTLKFLKELRKTRIHRLKLRQLLLLILRTLLVILTVIAFSRPTLKGSIPAGLAERAKTTGVILFDDSESMTAGDELGGYLKQAKNAALSVLNYMKDGDDVFLVKLSEVPTGDRQEPLQGQRNFRILRDDIERIQPSAMHIPIEDGLRYSLHLSASSKNFNKEIYVISDLQSGSLESVQTEKPGISFPPSTQIFLLPVGKRTLQNVAIESVEIPGAIFEVGKPFTVKAKLKNYGSSGVQNHLVSIYHDGNRTAQVGTDIPPGQSVDVEFTLISRHTGYTQGIVEIEDDDLEFDNRRYFTVFTPENLRVLLVGSQSDIGYIKLALRTRLSDSTSSMTIKETGWSRFSPLALNETDVLVLANPPELTEGQCLSIRNYLAGGKGGIIFPGTAATISALNKTISAILGFPETATLENLPGTRELEGSYIEFEKTDMRHPLFAGMFEEGNAKKGKDDGHNRVLESPKIRSAFQFLTNPRSRVIITLSSGFPFLFEETVGKGRVLIFCIPADMEWSDLPVKGIFVPLINRSAAYVSQEPASEHSYLAGEDVRIRDRALMSPGLKVRKPDGTEILIGAKPVSGGTFSGTDLPGFYSVTGGNTIYDGFCINTDPAESNTVRSDDERIENMLGRAGIKKGSVHTIDRRQQAGKTISEARFGSELWKVFLIAALLVAITEMLVARDTKSSSIAGKKEKRKV